MEVQTKAAWSAEWNGSYFDVTTDGGYSPTVAHIHINMYLPGGDTYDTAFARARLIAAAPELLEALKRCLRELHALFPNPAPHGAISTARAAIAKATQHTV